MIPTDVEVKPEKRGPRDGLKVHMGNYAHLRDNKGLGMPITGVVPDTPAERAGLDRNDRILMIGDMKIENVYDLMDVLI
jgi:S1-C subfamily serine protease